MTTADTDALVHDFTTLLTSYARSQYAGQTTHVHLLQAFNRGWAPKQIADACNRDLPRTRGAWRLIQTRIEWHATHDPAGRVSTPRPRPSLDGCEHTSDPNGWLMDADGVITGKCPCWNTPLSQGAPQR